jgi:hypothetical protein
VNRVAAALYAWNLFITTKGLGVGMGRNRPSSLITSLLSTVGLAGTITFLFAFFNLLSNAAPAYPDLRWAGSAYFICLATSGPDYDFVWIWIFLAIAVTMGCLSDTRRSTSDLTSLRRLSPEGSARSYQV